ncbi:ATPase [Escherichia coli]|uniref:ATPase n=1 Tax=Escherichia coli TaxID=562 RepID=A0A376MPL2_ECOLX|nr:ATPase [Escherichia coli]
MFLLPGMANRHGLITGATGTGKTVTLQKLAESLSEIGVPVFMADVKGDLTGIAQAGTASEKLLARLKNIGVNDCNRMLIRWWCGISLARKAIRCGRRFRIWGRCCWRGC